VRPISSSTTIQRDPASPMAMFRLAWRNRGLILTLTRRDIASRYRGSALGMLWSILNPLLMLAIYTFVFSQVFRMRWGSAVNTSPMDFALMLFAGMLGFTFFADSVNRSPGLILSTPNLVKKIVFPLEVQAFVVVGAGLFQALISFLILMCAFVLAKHQPPHWTIIFLPCVFLPLCLLVLGLAWFLSSLGVYMRDIGQLVGHLVTMTMFLSPLFYPVTAIPVAFRPLFYVNPMTLLMDQTRKVLIIGEPPSWGALSLYTVVTFVVASFGFWWFQRTRRGFADVL
jgi:lipopolysaccharide transport system permease protein